MKPALIPKANDLVRDHARDNPRASRSDVMRWLNNQRVNGERVMMSHDEVGRLIDEVRRSPPATKPLPAQIAPREYTTPLQAPLSEIARISIAPVIVPPYVPKRSATRDERKKWLESFVLEHPESTHPQIAAALMEEFGVGLDSYVVGAALKIAREAAGLRYSTKTHKPKEDPMPALVAPPIQLPPDDLLKEAGNVLKSLAARMQWASVTVKVSHQGVLTYSNELLPALPAKGEIQL